MKRAGLIASTVLALFSSAGSSASDQEGSLENSNRSNSASKGLFEELDPSVINSKPFQRAYWEFYQRAFPLGYIPKGAKGRAAKQIEEFKAKKSFSSPLPGPLSETD